MANIIKRSSGWAKISEKELEKTHSDLNIRLGKLGKPFEITYEPVKNQLTRAENFGKYVREIYSVYSSILEDMKSSRDWLALQVRSTYHSKADYADSIIIGSENEEDQVQVRGFYLDPAAFVFAWEDNTMDRPWKPWNWQLGILPEDLDETHYFFDNKSDRIIIGKGSKIFFYNLNPKFSKTLELFA